MIGIFDSGIGGVTVFKKIIEKIPNGHFVYYSDSINNPYGDKSRDELINIVDNIVNKLINLGVKVYLDESLKRFEFVYPACGSSNSAIKLTIPELEQYANYVSWVNVSK